MTSAQRLSISDVDSEVYPAVLALEKYVHKGHLDEGLLALVKIRASQINGCAWCLDMHAEEARNAGVPQRQIDVVAAWREAPALFSERERAALAFSEAVTRISDVGVPDPVWNAMLEVFDEKETVRLLVAIAAINVWNRLNVAVRTDLPERPAVSA